MVGSRIVSVDAVRGFALLGILVAHMVEQYLGSPSPPSRPQFGIFSIGMQLKVLVALGALLITMPLLMPRLHQLFSGVVAASLAVVK